MINKLIEFIEITLIKYIPGICLILWVTLCFNHILKGVFSYWLLALFFPLIGLYNCCKND